MKYLEEPQLSWLNSVLGSYEIGDRVLNGKLETYSLIPFGPIAAPATRKLLINLISTMNASFPDYDLAPLDLDNSERNVEAIAEAIKLDECDVYSYIPDMDSDPFSDGNLWSFNYFSTIRCRRKCFTLRVFAKA
ncbi:putative repressor of RNA polymerase III transcription Maf1 [Plasmopara halstedii]